MQRSDYGFHPLAQAQYEAIVAAGEVFHDGAGNVIRSPLHGAVNYIAAIAACHAADVDLRALLAGLLFEDHFGTDPGGGTALAKVFNFGGIKWAGQPGAFDSGIEFPHGEGIGPMGTFTYAGFHDFGGFVAELIRTLQNPSCGPAFTAGDLARAWGVYIGGPGNPNLAGGKARMDQFGFYLDHFPPQGGPPQDTFFIKDNPFGQVPVKIPFWTRWHSLDTVGLALPTLGYAKSAEMTTGAGRRVQQFERGWLGAQQATDPWDVVTLMPDEVAALGH